MEKEYIRETRHGETREGRQVTGKRQRDAKPEKLWKDIFADVFCRHV